MRYRRVVCLLLGIWIGVSAMLSFVASQNFTTLDDIVRSPPEQGSRIFNLLGPDNTRMLLRYMAGKQNVNMFGVWEQVQFAIGISAAALLFLGSTTRLLAAVPVAMLLLVTFLHFWIWPEMAWLNHLFVFGNAAAEIQARGHFWKLHGIYVAVEAVKDLLGIGLSAVLCLQQTTRRRSRHSRAADTSGSLHRGTATG